MAQQPTTFPQLLSFVKHRLIDTGVVLPSSVFIGVEPDENNLPPNMTTVIITPEPASSDNHELNFTVNWEITLTIWHYVALDEGEKANLALSTGTMSVYDTANSIIQSLALHYLENNSTDTIVIRPMRFISQSKISQRGKWFVLSQLWDTKFEYDIEGDD